MQVYSKKFNKILGELKKTYTNSQGELCAELTNGITTVFDATISTDVYVICETQSELEKVYETVQINNKTDYFDFSETSVAVPIITLAYQMEAVQELAVDPFIVKITFEQYMELLGLEPIGVTVDSKNVYPNQKVYKIYENGFVSLSPTDRIENCYYYIKNIENEILQRKYNSR